MLFLLLLSDAGCIQELTTCHNFYQRVKKAQDRLSIDSECDLNAMVKVEIKQEPRDDEGHPFDSQEFDFFHSFEANEDAIASDREDYSDRRRKREKTPKGEKSRKYRKLSIEERQGRGNRGIRRAKEAIKITTG